MPIEGLVQASSTDKFVSDGAGFLSAIREGNTELIRSSLLTKESQGGPVDDYWLSVLEIKDDDGWTPLMIASQDGHNQIVQLLISECGVDVNEEIMPNSDPNLKNKAFQDLKKMLGTKIRDIERIRYSALLLASKHGHPDVVKTLITHGANVNLNTGTTALRTASGFGQEECVRLLLDHGADISIAQPQSGGTAIWSASMVGHVGIAAMLIQHGADVNATTRQGGDTCLMIAAFYKHTRTVELLLKNGADPNKTNSDGFTALLYAAQRGDDGREMQELLLAHGAKATPFHILLFGPATIKRLWANRAFTLWMPQPQNDPSINYLLQEENTQKMD
jgi:ankyrin repeat protein